MDVSSIIQTISIWALPVIFAITLHEVAHGWAAFKLGDATAKMQGRLSLNPIVHIDPFGTVLLPVLLLVVQSPFIFGYAKPVPVNFGALRKPKRDMVWVALAGPGANLFMAFFWTGVFALGVNLMTIFPYLGYPMLLMGQAGVVINLVLMVLNLIPVPPLDGGRVAVGLLPHKLSWQLSRVEPYGFIILIILLFSGVLGQIIGPIINYFAITLLTFGEWL